MQQEDAVFMHKLNDETCLEEAVLGGAGILGQKTGAAGEFRTTEGDLSYEEATNCRLRDETNASMMFNSEGGNQMVKLNEIKVRMVVGA